MVSNLSFIRSSSSPADFPLSDFLHPFIWRQLRCGLCVWWQRLARHQIKSLFYPYVASKSKITWISVRDIWYVGCRSFINDELLIEMSVMMIAIKFCPKLCISNNKTQLLFPLPLYMRIPTHFSNEISCVWLWYYVQQYDVEFNCDSVRTITDYFVHLR